MNYELLSKITMREMEKLENELLPLRKRNEFLNNENENLKANIKKLEDEKATLEKEIKLLKDALEFKEDEGDDNEGHRFPHYS